METGKVESPTIEPEKPYTYDAIVVMPYTQVNRGISKEEVEENIFNDLSGPRTTHRMSHFTSRGILAGLELYKQGLAPCFILPGEQKNPSTAELERDYLLRRGIKEDNIFIFNNLNGSPEQMDPIADMQKSGQIGRVLVVSFNFHTGRVEEIMRRWGIDGDIAEVEETHLNSRHAKVKTINEERKAQGLPEITTKANREQLIDLPQLEPIKKAEDTISKALMMADKPFGRTAPFSRIFKIITGPTITDIRHTKTTVGLLRLEQVKKFLRLKSNATDNPGTI